MNEEEEEEDHQQQHQQRLEERKIVATKAFRDNNARGDVYEEERRRTIFFVVVFRKKGDPRVSMDRRVFSRSRNGSRGGASANDAGVCDWDPRERAEDTQMREWRDGSRGVRRGV